MNQFSKSNEQKNPPIHIGLSAFQKIEWAYFMFRIKHFALGFAVIFLFLMAFQ